MLWVNKLINWNVRRGFSEKSWKLFRRLLLNKYLSKIKSEIDRFKSHKMELLAKVVNCFCKEFHLRDLFDRLKICLWLRNSFYEYYYKRKIKATYISWFVHSVSQHFYNKAFSNSTCLSSADSTVIIWDRLKTDI